MADTNEDISSVKIDGLLKEQCWNVPNTNTDALKKAEAGLLALLAPSLRSEPGINTPAEEVTIA